MSILKFQSKVQISNTPTQNQDGSWRVWLWVRDGSNTFTKDDVSVGDTVFFDTNQIEKPSITSFTIVNIHGFVYNTLVDCDISYDSDNDNTVQITSFNNIDNVGVISKPTSNLNLSNTISPGYQTLPDWWAEYVSNINLQRLDDNLSSIIGLDSNGDYIPKGSSSSTSISDDIQELFQNLSNNSGNSNVTVSETAPENPSEGDLWYDSEDLSLKIFYGNATDSAGDDVWVEISSTDSFVVQSSNLNNISDNAQGVVVTGKVAADSLEIGFEGSITALGGTKDFRYGIVNFSGADVAGLDDTIDDQVDFHLNKDSSVVGDQVLSWNGTDYEWVDLPDLSGYTTNVHLEALQAEVTAIKNAPETLDTFQELVDYVNGLDSTQGLDIINGLATLQADVDANETAASDDRALIRTEFANADSTLQGNIDAVQSDVDQNEADGDADRALIRQEFAAADTAAATANADARAVIQADVDQNEADGDADRALIRQEFAAADATLSGRIDTLELTPPVTVSSNAPETPREGDLWWDTDDLSLRVFYGNSTDSAGDDVWVETSSSSYVNQTQSTLPSRSVVNTDGMDLSVGSDKILNNDEYVLGSIEGYKSYSLFQVDVSHADLWVVLYTDADSMNNDVGRTDINVDPSPGSGVIAEFKSDSDNHSIKVTPTVVGFNLDNVVNNKIYLRVKNISGSNMTESFSISLTLLQMEN